MATLQYIAHSAFALQDNGNQVLVDPFITGNPLATVSAGDFSPSTILLTHAHNDHIGDTIEIAQRSGATVIGTVEICDFLATHHCQENGANLGGTVQFEGGSVKFVPAWHTSAYTTNDGVQAPGVPAGLVVRFGGKTIYFAGDTCLFSDMQLIGEEGLDVAILPIGDHFTMGTKDAVRAVKFLDPKVVIPCHYNTFPPIEQDPEKFKQQVEAETSATCVVLKPGATYEL